MIAVKLKRTRHLPNEQSQLVADALVNALHVAENIFFLN